MLPGIGLFLQLGAAEVQMGKQVRPETVTVGQHFQAVVRVRAAAGSTFRFPSKPDSDSAVDTAGRATRANASDPGFAEATVTYVLAAWDTGPQRLGLGDVVVATPSGNRLAALGDMKVYVRSVLPADTALRKPKPYRPAIFVGVTNWIPYAIAALAVALLAGLIWLCRRLRGRANAPLSPLAWAESEFDRIEKSGRVEAGEGEWVSIESANVLRGYLARAIPELRSSLTTRELASAYDTSSAVAHAATIGILERADVLKFARGTTSAEAAREQLARSRATVREIDVAIERSRAAARESKAA